MLQVLGCVMTLYNVLLSTVLCCMVCGEDCHQTGTLIELIKCIIF